MRDLMKMALLVLVGLALAPFAADPIALDRIRDSEIQAEVNSLRWKVNELEFTLRTHTGQPPDVEVQPGERKPLLPVQPLSRTRQGSM